MSTIRTRRSLPVLLAAVMVVMTVGVAYAAWSASGAGEGHATSGQAQPLTINPTSPGQPLYPGKASHLDVAIDNPNPYPVMVTGIGSVGIATNSGNATCDASTGITFDGSAATGIVVPASTVGFPFTFPAPSVAMDNTSDDSCQNELFRIQLTLSGESAA